MAFRVELAGVAVYFMPVFAELRRLGQREEHDFFAGHGADVVVQAQVLSQLDSKPELHAVRFHRT